MSSRIKADPRVRSKFSSLKLAPSGLLHLAVLVVVLASGRALLSQKPAAKIQFRNVAAAAGLNFVLENDPTASKHLIETMPGGVAAFDYDGDGLTASAPRSASAINTTT